MNDHEILIGRYLDGTGCADELLRLEHWLLASEQNRRIFAEWSFEDRLAYDALISQRSAASDDGLLDALDPSDVGELPTTRLRQRARDLWSATCDVASNYWALSLLVAGLFVAIMVLSMAHIVPDWKRFVPGNEPNGPSVEFVAHITRFEQTTWDETSDGNLMNRDLFVDDKLILKEGLAVITYNTGAGVVLEGPATYSIQGANGGNLLVGKLVARIDTQEARGFIVDTPSAQVTDLGTEFGLDVRPDGSTVAVTFEGSIEVVGSQTSQVENLTAGRAAVVDVTGLRVIPVPSGDVFVRNVAAYLARHAGLPDEFDGSNSVAVSASQVTFIRADRPNENQLGRRQLIIGSNTRNGPLRGLLSFDLSELRRSLDDKSGRVSAVFLVLHGLAGQPQNDNWQIELRLTHPFDAASARWNTIHADECGNVPGGYEGDVLGVGDLNGFQAEGRLVVQGNSMFRDTVEEAIAGDQTFHLLLLDHDETGSVVKKAHFVSNAPATTAFKPKLVVILESNTEEPSNAQQ